MAFMFLRETIRATLERDPAARSSLTVLLCYPGLHALTWHRLAHALWQRGVFLPARIVSHLSRFLTGIEIHPAAVMGRRVIIDHGMGVVIGETAVVGDDVYIYHQVTLGGTSLVQGKRHPTIGNNVILGAGAKVLGAITVGDGARVGTSAVVLEPVAAGATVVGIPARPVDQKQRAKDPCFDPYGMPHDPCHDPILQAVESLRAELCELESRVGRLSAAHADPAE